MRDPHSDRTCVLTNIIHFHFCLFFPDPADCSLLAFGFQSGLRGSALPPYKRCSFYVLHAPILPRRSYGDCALDVLSFIWSPDLSIVVPISMPTHNPLL